MYAIKACYEENFMWLNKPNDNNSIFTRVKEDILVLESLNESLLYANKVNMVFPFISVQVVDIDHDKVIYESKLDENGHDNEFEIYLKKTLEILGTAIDTLKKRDRHKRVFSNRKNKRKRRK